MNTRYILSEGADSRTTNHVEPNHYENTSIQTMKIFLLIFKT